MSQACVLDASAGAEFLLGTPAGRRAATALAAYAELHAPHLVVTETLSVIRGWERGGLIDAGRALTACADLTEMPWHLWDATPLVPAVWALRHNLTAYDATYVALAAAIDCPLVTGDRRLARATPSDLDVHLVD